MRQLPLATSLLLACATLIGAPVSAQSRAADPLGDLISVHAPVFVLNHVRVIDGTGAPARDDQAVVVANGKIQSIGPAASVTIPTGAQVLDRTGYSVIPGLVGMHDHLYYTDSASFQVVNGRIPAPGLFVAEIPYTAPRLYLAAGVTTARTTGSLEPYTDLRVKRLIDNGLMPGPALDTTAPYLEGPQNIFAQMHQLSGPDDATRLVDYWAAEGATSYKAYMHITRAELGAAVTAAHAHHLKLTGHLCSVTWPEAISLGIDDFEHGPIFTDTEFVSDKQPDECPSRGSASWEKVDIHGPEVTKLIQDLVSHHVAVTSTLPVFECSVPGRPQLQQRTLDALTPEAAESYLIARAHVQLNSPMVGLFRKEMDFELAFSRAGGLLLAGPDPTGNGCTLPGYGDQREIELLVEAGFTPEQAIQIGTENGAKFLGREDQIGTLAAGKQADIVLVKGDPAKRIDDIENVETVFKDGVGFDAAKLVESVRHQVGMR